MILDLDCRFSIVGKSDAQYIAETIFDSCSAIGNLKSENLNGWTLGNRFRARGDWGLRLRRSSQRKSADLVT